MITTLLHRPWTPPMSQAQAETLLDAMRRETKSKAARVAVLRLAIGPAGNLSPDALVLYCAQLVKELQQ